MFVELSWSGLSRKWTWNSLRFTNTRTHTPSIQLRCLLGLDSSIRIRFDFQWLYIDIAIQGCYGEAMKSFSTSAPFLVLCFTSHVEWSSSWPTMVAIAPAITLTCNKKARKHEKLLLFLFPDSVLHFLNVASLNLVLWSHLIAWSMAYCPFSWVHCYCESIWHLVIREKGETNVGICTSFLQQWYD